MMIRFHPHRLQGKDIWSRHQPCLLTTLGRLMRWEKPQAVDFRYGMEITMYIANR